MKKLLCAFIAFMGMVVAFAQSPNYQGIVYVTPTGAGTHSGDSWANATSAIDTAQTIAQANNCVVWVAAGIYYGNTTAQNAFTMADGVNVYGGFAGTESASYNISLRDFVANETILDGDTARRVLYQPSVFSDTTIWDGFTIRNGYSSNYGGGAWLKGKAMLHHCRIHDNTSVRYGGGVCANRSTVTDCEIHNNMSEDGGGVYADYATIVTNCEIYNNMSEDDGGGVYANDATIVTNCEIYNNISEDYGGGVYANSSTVINCEIRNNTGHYGGSGVYALHSSSITDCDIYENNGNAVYLSDSSSITDCDIYDNNGGGVNANTSIVANCEIHDNISEQNSGGGVIGTYATVIDCKIYNNTTGYRGGGVNAQYSTVSDCEIHNNTANFSGGGVYIVYNTIVTNCEIHDNTSAGYEGDGGGVYASYSSVVTNCEIYGNLSAEGRGGGLYASSSSIVADCEIHDNTTERYGGGGVFANGSTVSNCQIYDNITTSPESHGGGVYAAYSSIVTGCGIYNNTASLNGGGVYAGNSTTISNSTIVRNKDGGIFTSQGNNNVVNCIVWGNESDGMADNVSGTNIECRFSAIGGGYEGEGNIDVTDMELFVNPSLTAGAEDATENVDWHLVEGAVCINRGNNDEVIDSVDLDGYPRIQCDTVDMGCYEYNCNHTGIAQHETCDLTLYPNPTTGIVTVRLSPETCNLKPEIQVFDVYGRRLAVVGISDAHGASLQGVEIDLSNYSTGIYIIKLVNNGSMMATSKVVKQ